MAEHDDVLIRVRELLSTCNTMTLATASDGRPWAATVFFASDEQSSLYFVTDPRTHHGRHLSQDGRVVVAIDADAATWHDVVGLQIEGHATVVEGEARAQALEHYLHKFPDVQRLFENPRDESERNIAERLRHTPFWRLSPDWIRLIDSTRGFGWKREIRLRETSEL